MNRELVLQVDDDVFEDLGSIYKEIFNINCIDNFKILGVFWVRKMK